MLGIIGFSHYWVEMSQNMRSTQSNYGISSSVLLVNERQRGNPIIRHIKNVRYEYTKDTAADYAMTSTCVIFVSVKYHLLHSMYTQRRLREIGKAYRVRVLLVSVDEENSTQALLDLNELSFSHDFTLILAWSDLECARYLECLREYEGKSSAPIQEKVETEHIPRVTKVLTEVKSVNKTDVNTLLDSFGTIGNIFKASEQQLLMCPGVGEKKVKRLYQVFHEPLQKRPRIQQATSNSSSQSNIQLNPEHDIGQRF